MKETVCADSLVSVSEAIPDVLPVIRHYSAYNYSNKEQMESPPNLDFDGDMTYNNL